jgi:hypothetical protein
MATKCPGLVRGRRFRFTKLDSCGAPVIGASSVVVTSGLISVAPSPQYEGGDPIRVQNAAGELCINDPGYAELAQEDLEITLCTVDPGIFSIAFGAPLVVDAATPTPNTVGFRKQCGNSEVKFALEVWTDVSGEACTSSAKPYGYFLWPLVTNAQYGDYTIENGAIQMTFTASAFCNSPWANGPYNVTLSALSAPGPLLSPITAADLFHFQETLVPPPAAVCGLQALAAP